MVPEHDVMALANAMVRLVADGRLRRKMGKAAFQRVKNQFDLNKQNAIWRQIMNDLMKMNVNK